MRYQASVARSERQVPGADARSWVSKFDTAFGSDGWRAAHMEELRDSEEDPFPADPAELLALL